MDYRPQEQNHQEDTSVDLLLGEFISSLPEGFHLDLVQAYMVSPCQETIEKYLDNCRRTSPDTQGER